MKSPPNRIGATRDTPFKFYEPRTTRTAKTRRNRPYKLSRLEIQRTLHISGERENYLFVENSAGYWLLGTLPFTWSFPDLLWRFGLLGTLRFLFAIFAHFAVKITTDTPFKFHEPRTTRTVRTRASSSFTALSSHPGGEGKPSPWTLSRTALNLLGTLRFRTMNREQREQYEQGDMGAIRDTPFLFSSSLKDDGGLGYRLQPPTDTPVFPR